MSRGGGWPTPGAPSLEFEFEGGEAAEEIACDRATWATRQREN